jgi:acetyl-CoA decarbonylase/synthase complex subunit gamma
VKRLSGFKVSYGPIRSEDIESFIRNGYKATPEMRRKTFGTWERLVLIPVELVDALKVAAIVLPLFFLLGGMGGPGPFWSNAVNYGLFAVVALVGALLGGAILTPVLLPWLPGRAFSLKGLVPGVTIALGLSALRTYWWEPAPGTLEMLAWLLIVPAASTYLAMNFTGASTYTSLSGVKKEMRIAVPLQITAAAAGIALWVGSRLTT